MNHKTTLNLPTIESSPFNISKNIKNLAVSSSYKPYINDTRIKLFNIRKQDEEENKTKSKTSKNLIFLTKESTPKSNSNPKINLLSQQPVDLFSLNFFEFIKESVKEINYDLYFDKIKTLEECYSKLTKKFVFSNDHYKKHYNKQDKKESILSISSISIEFKKNNSDITEISQLLPFDFIPILSLCNYEEMYQILAQSISLTNNEITIKDNFKDIIKRLYLFNDNDSIDDKYKFNEKLNFGWITEDNIYTASISNPFITLEIPNLNFKIIKSLEINYILTLYKNDFENWHEIIINDLLISKQFRQHFNQVISKSYQPWKNLEFKIEKPIFIKTDELDTCNVYIIYTLNNLNYLLNLSGYVIENKKILNKSFKVKNWKHTISMIKLREISSLENIVNRRAKIYENGSFLYDESWLDKINNETVFFYKNSNNSLSKKLPLRIVNPRIDWSYIDKGRLSKGQNYISDDYLIKMKDFERLYEFYEFIFYNVKNLLVIKDEKKKSHDFDKSNKSLINISRNEIKNKSVKIINKEDFIKSLKFES